MESNKIKQLETICAPATANGTSAIGIIRVTGEKAIEIVREVFLTFKGKKTELYFSIKPKVKIGYIIDSNKNIIDEVVCLIYRAPRSYTGENLVEIQHHGSIFIQQEIIKILIEKVENLEGTDGEEVFAEILDAINKNNEISAIITIKDNIRENSKSAICCALFFT